MLGIFWSIITVLAWGSWLAPSQNVSMKSQQAKQKDFRMRRLILLFSVYVLIWGMMSCSQQSADKITISVIPKGTSHVFWQSVHAGAIKASKELGVDIVWIGPDKEDDRRRQAPSD